MKLISRKLNSLLAAVVFAASSVTMVAYAPPASAQVAGLDATTTQALNDALATGNAQAVMLVVASKQGDPAATAAIAATILAAAQSIKAADPSGAGILAAIALASGGLQGNAAVTATNLVNVSGSAIAATVVSFANAGVPPAVIANAVLIGVTTNPVQMAQSGSNFASGNSGNTSNNNNNNTGGSSGRSPQ